MSDCAKCGGSGYVPSAIDPRFVCFCPICRPYGVAPAQTGAVRSEGNVRILPVVTRHDLPTDRILISAQDANLKRCIVVGEEQDGSFWFAATFADGPEVLWALERAKLELMNAGVPTL